MFTGLIAFVISIAAVGLVFYSWRQRDVSWAAVAGWLLALGSAFVWSNALGPEFGVTYAIMVFICLIWVVVAFLMEAPKAATEADGRSWGRIQWPGARTCFKHGAKFLLSVPAAGVTAIMLSTALVFHLPWTMTAKFALALFLFPLLWGALSAWICAQTKLARPALVSVGLFATSYLLLFIPL